MYKDYFEEVGKEGLSQYEDECVQRTEELTKDVNWIEKQSASHNYYAQEQWDNQKLNLTIKEHPCTFLQKVFIQHTNN